MDGVVIVDSDPRWPNVFAQEAERVRAVPGLAAKPIIDLLLGVHSLDEARRAVPALAELGYAFWYDNPDTDRLFFVKGLPPNGPRTHHLHIVEPDSPLWERLLFRDYLLTHPEEVQRYAALKRDLAARFPTDREGYTQAKADYILQVTHKARQNKEAETKQGV